RGFLGYFIYRNGILHHVLNNPSQTSWVDQNLANGNYSYYLTARYTSGLSVPSNTVNVTIYVAPEILPPYAVTAELVGERDVFIQWSSPSEYILSFKLYRNNVEIAETTGTNFTDLNLDNGSYQYNLRAVYLEGTSSVSATVVVNIMVASPPVDVEAAILDGDSVMLSWSAPNQGEIGFIVYRNGVELVYLPGTLILHYADNDLPNGTYTYQVVAVYPYGVSNVTSPITIVIEIPYSPRDFTLLEQGDRVMLEWQAPLDTGGLQGYNLYRNGSLYQYLVLPGFIDENLANGSYNYQISSVYGSSESVLSPMLSVAIEVLYSPSNLQAMVNQDVVNLTWQAVADPGGFLYYSIVRNGSEIAQTNSLTYGDQNLANGAYSYTIRGVYGFGTSLPTNLVAIEVEVLYPPTALVSVIQGSDVQLSWNAAATSGGLRSLQTYLIYRNGILLSQTNATSYTDTGLVNGSYQYYVQASYTSGVSAPTATVAAQIAVLYPPAALNHTVLGDNVSLSWQAVSSSGTDLLHYNIYRNGVMIATATATTYADNQLANGTYQYSVTAVYPSGESVATNTSTALIEVLYAPSNLSHTLVTNSVSLSWQAAPNSGRNVLGYQVYRNGTALALVSALQYVDNDLNNGLYEYYVTAVYASGSSIPTNTIQVNVLVPYTPENFTASVSAPNNAVLQWTLPDQGETAFRIYRNWSVLTTINNAGINTYTDANLPNGSYNYQVSAVYGSVESILTPVEMIEINVAYSPMNLVAIPIENSIRLEWSPPAQTTGLTGYRAYAFLNGEFLSVTNTTATLYAFPSMVNGSYTFHVTAMFGAEESAPSNVASLDMQVVYSPVNLTGILSGNTISLQWQSPLDQGGLTGYNIYQNHDLIASTASNSYQLLDLPNAAYLYYVTSNYTFGESLPGNSYQQTVLLAY
ncbi:MAG: fibronectin type III domain-containing protein, partial [Candidatus Cloacimonadaceae bacterium]|nr:fibronectin type III domain-containing protein [Candidatus Cloacimonadaceae bacterium]